MKFSLAGIGALALTLVLAGCQQATSSASSDSSVDYDLTFGDQQTLSLTSDSTVTYWDLDTGTEVTDATSTTWDVAFSSATQGIWTNSGATATGVSSSGVGGVYYTGYTVFANVTKAATSLFTGTWATDTEVYVSTTTGAGTSTSTAILNKMTALDYSGSGTEADPYTSGTYDGDAYYSYSSTTHAISASGEVYIIRSGDGTKYFKFQVAEMSGSTSSRVRDIKYAVSN